MELKSISFGEFKEKVESFVSENFRADGCRECHEIGHDIVPDDWKNANSKEKESSYEKALKKLFDELF